MLSEAIRMLEQEQYLDAAIELINLFNKNDNRKEAWEILNDVYILPNQEAILENDRHNRQLLNEQMARYCLPTASYMAYQLVPLEDNVLALLDKEKAHILMSNEANAKQNFYMRWFSEMLDEKFLLEQLHIIQKEYERYREKAIKVKADISQQLDLEKRASAPFLDNLKAYFGLSGDKEFTQFFLAKEMYNRRDFSNAEEILIKILRKKALNIPSNILLADIYKETKRYLNEGKILFSIFLLINNQAEIISPDLQEAVKTRFTKWMEKATDELLQEVFSDSIDMFFFPRGFYFKLNSRKDSQINVETFYENFYGIFLRNNSQEEYKPFVALVADSYEGMEAQQAALFNQSKSANFYMFIRTETVVAKKVKDIQIGVEGKRHIVPICGLKAGQNVNVSTVGENRLHNNHLRYLEYMYFKIDGPTQVKSNDYYILGEPIEICHKKDNNPLILTIFIDTASYSYMKLNNWSCCPQLKRYFQEGVVLNHNFVTGEYTYPVFATLITGLMTSKHQMYNRKAHVKLSEDILTLAEKFRDKGYYTAMFTSHTQMHFTNFIRGFQKVISQFAHYYKVNDMVSNVIEHLDAFQGTDNFIWMSLMDVHKSVEDLKLPLSVQTQLTLEEQNIEDGTRKSVFRKESSARIKAYEKYLSEVDHQLGVLFRYIEEHYHEDEYIIAVCSDHGASFLNHDVKLLKDYQTHTCAMYRGANVPGLGIVDDEITSSVDLFPTLCHLAGIEYDESQIDGRLPKVFGGAGHEYVFSESLYPGQTYKLCIRNLNYEFFLETAAFTSYDGKVDMSKYQTELFRRSDQQKVKDKTLERVFLNEAYKFLRQNGELKI